MKIFREWMDVNGWNVNVYVVDGWMDVCATYVELLKFAEMLIHFRFGKFIALHS